MKKYLVIAVAVLASTVAFAKKVKFATDMTGIPVNAAGMHITGDFQDEAGYAGGDWQPNTTQLFQEASDTNIYSVVVDIPAFRAYEFKFVNGEFSYEVEFVPIESRVLFNFGDNRWLYVDSLVNDTTFAGAIRFSQNAPAGKNLLRFYVDLQNEPSVALTGVHVEGGFQNWMPGQTRMYSFDGHTYEYIAYIDSVTVAVQDEFLYVNGNTGAEIETVPSACATVNNYRSVYVVNDTMLATVCFSACVDCQSVGVSEYSFIGEARISPNPANEYAMIEFNDKNAVHDVYVYDVTGAIVRRYESHNSSYLRVEKNELANGIYFLGIYSRKGTHTTQKLIFN
jgi:hypothetical protein